MTFLKADVLDAAVLSIGVDFCGESAQNATDDFQTSANRAFRSLPYSVYSVFCPRFVLWRANRALRSLPVSRVSAGITCFKPLVWLNRRDVALIGLTLVSFWINTPFSVLLLSGKAVRNPFPNLPASISCAKKRGVAQPPRSPS